MKTSTLKSDSILLLAAAIWGFAFVAQRAGMEHVGPFIFNGVRFALGSLSLLPLILMNRNRRGTTVANASTNTKMLFWGSCLAGGVLFGGSSLQQVGIVFTTAGKAGFITGLYVIIVPILGLLWRQWVALGTWIGAVFAAIGLYLLSVTESFAIARGDLLVFFGAVVWAVHVHVLGWLSPKVDSYKLACLQYAICSLLSLIVAFSVETIVWADLMDAAIPILYGGIFSVGIAFTLQIVAQRKAHPAHVAIILSLEGVFAAFGGWLLLGESLSSRGLAGCALMLAGMILSQINFAWRFSKSTLKNISSEV